MLKKANSVGYKTTTTRLFSSVSTEECLETNDTTKVTKQTKQRLWSLQLFGVKVCWTNWIFCFCGTISLESVDIIEHEPNENYVNQFSSKFTRGLHFSLLLLLSSPKQNPQQNQLCELLNTYTKNGVPKSKSSFINSEYSDEALEALYDLPSSWRDFVNPCDISETDTKIQSAIWELVTTEVDYIHAIQTVTDVSTITSYAEALFYIVLGNYFDMCKRICANKSTLLSACCGNLWLLFIAQKINFGVFKNVDDKFLKSSRFTIDVRKN